MREKIIKDLTTNEIEAVAEAIAWDWRSLAMRLNVYMQLRDKLPVGGSTSLEATTALMKLLREKDISIKKFKDAFLKEPQLDSFPDVENILSQVEIEEMTGTSLATHSLFSDYPAEKKSPEYVQSAHNLI